MIASDKSNKTKKKNLTIHSVIDGRQLPIIWPDMSTCRLTTIAFPLSLYKLTDHILKYTILFKKNKQKNLYLLADKKIILSKGIYLDVPAF